MKVTVNFAEVQSKSVVPAGDYPSVVADVLAKEKVGSDHPYLNWDLVIAEGDYEGRHVYYTTSLKPEALWNLQGTLQNLGFEATEENFEVEWDDQTGQLTSPEVINLPCIAVVYNEPYNGRLTSKVSSLLGPNGEDVSGQSQAAAAAPAPAAPSRPGARPATKASPAPAAAAAKNGPAPARRTPFPAGKAGGRQFK